MKTLALVSLTFLSLVLAEDQQTTEDNPFYFDYHRLRVGGLVLAAILCLIGITILLSGHCRCKFSQDKRRRTGSNAQAMLSDTARASECWKAADLTWTSQKRCPPLSHVLVYQRNHFSLWRGTWYKSSLFSLPCSRGRRKSINRYFFVRCVFLISFNINWLPKKECK